MTYGMDLGNDKKLIVSDVSFKPYRKKPTISILDEKKAMETLIASFTNQETFEYFVKIVTGEAEK